MLRTTWLITAAVLILIVGLRASCAGEESSRKDLYEHLHRSSVEVLVDRHMAGSGCLVDANGCVLTAAHLFRQSRDKIEMLMPNKSRLPAKLIAVDEGHDLALLQLPEREEKYPHLALADDIPLAGKSVYLFGAPLFRHAVMIRGSVARCETTFEYIDGRYVEVFHVCAPTAKGVSGGPWVNRQGKVFGVQSAVMSLGDAQQGIAFVAPLDAIRRLIDSRRSARTTTLGFAVEEISEQPRPFLDQLNKKTTGLVVRQLKKNGPAALAGLKDGDIVTLVDGQAIEFRDDLLRIVRVTEASTEIQLIVVDSKSENRREVTVRPTVLESE